MEKNEIANVFEEIALFLELKGDNPFRIRAYRNAARSLVQTEKPLKKMIQEGSLLDVPGIGADLAEKIERLASDKKLPLYEELKKSTPKELIELMRIPGLGPKRVKILYQKLKIRTAEDVKRACLDGKIAKLKGFGPKTAKNLLDAIGYKETQGKRRLWWSAVEIATPILEGLKKLKGVKKAEICGSLRRKLETIGDLDFLVSASNPGPIMEWFATQSFVEKVLNRGDTKSSVLTSSGMQADLRIVSEEEFGFALCYFTGSKEHNIKLRSLALKKGWSLSEYGIESKKSPPPRLGKHPTEADLYKALGLSPIPPELREDTGEIELAAKETLPTLIEEKDIRGTLHNHTTASDGRSSLQEMVQAAEDLGWDYIGIADHSKSSVQANGQTEEKLLAQVELIEKLNRSKQFKTHIFAGVECDILSDGKLDFSNDILKQLDYVVVSIHSSLSQDEKTLTKRIIRTLENPHSTIMGHVTGRLLLKREAYKVNIQKVIDACIANGKIMELNANPQRLDMDWRLWHKARDKGLLCCINTDAHSKDHLRFFKAGVNVARKGWLRKQDVVNTRPLKEFRKVLN
jgi:DNA polymerase (family 10)